MDIWCKEKRSEVMSRIRSKNTKPEMKVRSLLYCMGFRFRLHDDKLPGKPDIILPKYKTVIFVNGCFWHLHKNCRDGTIPKTQHDKWKEKLEKNVTRDKLNQIELERLGWKVIILWECQVEKKTEEVAVLLKTELLK